jgi:hypothetical protein
MALLELRQDGKQSELAEYIFANPFPAAPPVETFRYRPDRQSKGPHPSRLRRPGPLLDFAEPGRLPRVIDGRLRRGKRISRRNILPQRQTFLNFKYKLEVQSNENVR